MGQALGAFGRREESVTDMRLSVAREGESPHERTAQALEGDTTDVRLVGTGNTEDPRRMRALGDGEMTDVRLIGAHAVEAKFMETALGGDKVTDVRLVGANDTTSMQYARALSAAEHRQLPALLVSYAYFKQFTAQRARYCFRDYSLDSGAFTANKSGVPVDLQEYTEVCRELLADDPQCVEVFALDVIGDWQASLHNAEAMWSAGVPAIPTYHYGSPEAALLEIARQYPKIALGGAVGLHSKEKKRWVEACFARVWPKRVHGFGMMAKALLFAVPFDSVDASNWELAPAGFGSYKSMGKAHRAPRGHQVNLRAEVEWYLKLERELKQQWSRELAGLSQEVTA